MSTKKFILFVIAMVLFSFICDIILTLIFRLPAAFPLNSYIYWGIMAPYLLIGLKRDITDSTEIEKDK